MGLDEYMKINGKDVWSTYKGFLCELSEAAHENMDALLATPKVKAYTTVSFRERNGEELPETLPDPMYEAIDRTLQFCIIGNSIEDRMQKYNAFMLLLKSGWLLIDVKNVRIYKMTYQEQTNLMWYDDPTVCCCTFKIKFREHKPYE